VEYRLGIGSAFTAMVTTSARIEPTSLKANDEPKILNIQKDPCEYNAGISSKS
jgi:hypothetical protein